MLLHYEVDLRPLSEAECAEVSERLNAFSETGFNDTPQKTGDFFLDENIDPMSVIRNPKVKLRPLT